MKPVSLLLLILLSLGVLYACREEAEPEAPATELARLDSLPQLSLPTGDNKAFVTSQLLSKGGGAITAYGHVWSATNQQPTIADARTELKTASASVPFSFTSTLSPLLLNTTYYVRAYATNAKGTVYGAARSFRLQTTFSQLLGTALEDSLRNKNVGYSYVVYENGTQVASGSGGFRSRNTEPEGQRPFGVDSKLHIASMSKTLTAIAFLRLAAEKEIRTTDRILPYLPPAWAKGPNVELITFRDLLTHTSGIIGLGNRCENGAYSENIYGGLKQLIAKGVQLANRGNYCYQNANLGLFRILIPAIAGYTFSGNDLTDEIQTQQLYRIYVQQHVFQKVGIQNVQTTFEAGNTTYTYDFPFSGVAGWNPGNFDWTAGAYGWYLTADEAGKLFATVLSTPNQGVLPEAYKDTLLQKNLASFRANSVAGTAYYHDGRWFLQTNSRYRGLRTIWIKFPNQITVVLFTNALHATNGNFPSTDGTDIVAYVLRAYNRARQAVTGRAAVSDWVIERPDPH